MAWKKKRRTALKFRREQRRRDRRHKRQKNSQHLLVCFLWNCFHCNINETFKVKFIIKTWIMVELMKLCKSRLLQLTHTSSHRSFNPDLSGHRWARLPLSQTRTINKHSNLDVFTTLGLSIVRHYFMFSSYTCLNHGLEKEEKDSPKVQARAAKTR